MTAAERETSQLAVRGRQFALNRLVDRQVGDGHEGRGGKGEGAENRKTQRKTGHRDFFPEDPVRLSMTFINELQPPRQFYWKRQEWRRGAEVKEPLAGSEHLSAGRGRINQPPEA